MDDRLPGFAADDGTDQRPTRRHEFFWIDVVPLREAVVVLLGGELDIRTVDRFACAVDTAFAMGGEAVIIDIARVEFFGAAGIHVLAKAQILAASSGQSLRVVVDEQRLLLRVLRFAGMTGGLALFHELGAAVDAAADTTGEIIDFGDLRPS